MSSVMLRSIDFLRRIIAPVGGQGGVTMSYLCPHCNGSKRMRHLRACALNLLANQHGGGLLQNIVTERSHGRPAGVH